MLKRGRRHCRNACCDSRLLWPASAVARVHAPCSPRRYCRYWKNHAREPDCPVLQNHPRWNNPPAFMCLSMHCRWCNRARTANNEVRREKNVFNLIFIAKITNSFSVPSMDIMGMPACLYLAYPPCSKFKASQRKREMKKMVRTNVILSFCSEIHFKTNHWGHGSLADINWLLLPSHNSDPLSFLPLYIERSHSVKIWPKGEGYWCILCFYHKAFSWQINCHSLWCVTFLNQIYLLI